MSRKSRKSSPKKQAKQQQKVFTTIDEFSAYFFPKGRAEKELTKGRERGTKAAENAFTEIAKSVHV